ncbi:MAG: lactoylglutathione lyase [Cardiobacteriaceae bacterium]|nr:lactoylglutathione lyase [Cardiobacteriaceae bacterium]
MSFPGIPAAGATSEHATQTRGFIYNHTMLRVKDPAKSLDFYTRILGMTLLRKSDYEGGKFSLYFLAMLRGDENIPQDDEARRAWIAGQSGILELTHNWGTENDPGFSYHNGNSEPRGFGHICFSVPDFTAAIRWFDNNHIPYQKRPEDGTMKHIAFIKDPDEYWVEIIQN